MRYVPMCSTSNSDFGWLTTDAGGMDMDAPLFHIQPSLSYHKQTVFTCPWCDATMYAEDFLDNNGCCPNCGGPAGKGLQR